MPFSIDDEITIALVDELAKRRGVTMQDAVRHAARAELDRIEDAVPIGERLEVFWRECPLPPPTGEKADKGFFDELSGDL